MCHLLLDQVFGCRIGGLGGVHSESSIGERDLSCSGALQTRKLVVDCTEDATGTKAVNGYGCEVGVPVFLSLLLLMV
jgi:hypothetical protein